MITVYRIDVRFRTSDALIDIFCIHNQIDASARTNYLIWFLKSKMPETGPDKERKLYARIESRQHPIS